ncbi:PAS domain-containing protein [Aureococcus anophagefferens]|nr:PAS domain-containing protein [Aureococcus anophagefferens]
MRRAVGLAAMQFLDAGALRRPEFRIAVLGDVHDQWRGRVEAETLERVVRPDLFLAVGDFANEDAAVVENIVASTACLSGRGTSCSGTTTRPGLGEDRAAICGKDWTKRASDFGDDDLRDALDTARTPRARRSAPSGTPELRGGGARRMVHEDARGTLHVNAAKATTINLDDIFADCFFTQDGEARRGAAESSARRALARNPGRPQVDLMDGGMLSTSPDDASAPPLQSSSAAPMEEAADDDDDGPAPPLGAAARGGAVRRRRAKPKRSRAASAREMTEQQKDERRERNREHAKRSRCENDKLRVAIRDKMGDAVANELLARCGSDGKKTSLIARDPSDATRILDDPDYSLVKALQTAQQNFVITDPSLPDNPIVFASHGFLTLTGYSLESIRKAVDEGYDTSVCLLNYRIDGSTFFNQFFVAPLRDGQGNVVNYVGVQCQVSDQRSERSRTSTSGFTKRRRASRGYDPRASNARRDAAADDDDDDSDDDDDDDDDDAVAAPAAPEARRPRRLDPADRLDGGDPYWWNRATNEVTWDEPTAAADEPRHAPPPWPRPAAARRAPEPARTLLMTYAVDQNYMKAVFKAFIDTARLEARSSTASGPSTTLAGHAALCSSNTMGTYGAITKFLAMYLAQVTAAAARDFPACVETGGIDQGHQTHRLRYARHGRGPRTIAATAPLSSPPSRAPS